MFKKTIRYLPVLRYEKADRLHTIRGEERIYKVTDTDVFSNAQLYWQPNDNGTFSIMGEVSGRKMRIYTTDEAEAKLTKEVTDPIKVVTAVVIISTFFIAGYLV